MTAPGDPLGPVDKARWQQLSPHLDELLDLPPEARAGRLDEWRARDPAMAAELAALLGRLDALDHDAFLDQPALPRPATLCGARVGAYTVERELGQGGMGSVWLARRTDGRFEGQVAIKFLHAGLVPRADAERFAREGRILARLAHPHIARLLDAGVLPGTGAATASQQPYLVLEYVDGEPIDQHCSHHGLDLAQRLALFMDVLAAIAHAHHRLILHRDIKPSNILVTRGGEVKLLDFGIAKLMRDDTGSEPGATELTRRVGRAFTLQYAAPEQLQDGEVTTATDVYALGVLLYVLLGGSHPTPAPTGATLDQMRATLERQPRRLSDAVLRRGGADAARQARALRGDLDTIVARALKKSPAERYPNAEAFADDLRRHLQHEPIAARRDSAAYVLAKFARRHRAGVAASAAVVLALGAGLGIAWREADEARRQQAQAEGLIEFMIGDLRSKLQPVGRLDALSAPGEKALAYYAAQDPARLDADSLGRRARALHLIGEIADERGDLDEAARLFQRAAESTGELLERHPDDAQRVFDHAQSQYWVGYVARRRGRADAAEPAFQAYLALAERLVQLEPRKVDWQLERADALLALGVLQLERSQHQPALRAFDEARKVFAAHLAFKPGMAYDLVNARGWMAKAEEYQGDLAGALASQRGKLSDLGALPQADKDRHAQRLMANAEYEIGRLALAMGDAPQSLAAAQSSAARFDALLAVDPANRDWQAQANVAHLGLGEAWLAAGQRPQARAELARADAAVAQLLQTSDARPGWRTTQPGMVLRLRAAIGDDWPDRTDALAGYLARVRQAEASGLRLDTEQAVLVAYAALALGDALAQRHDEAAARAQWDAAADRVRVAAHAGHPESLALWAGAAARQGDLPRAQEGAARLAATGFRRPDWAQLASWRPPGAGAMTRTANNAASARGAVRHP
ncbi:MAG: protein kinase [Burkholderiaceae bacterium]